MSSISQPRTYTFRATAAIKKGSAVKIGATNEYVTEASAVSDKTIGIALYAAASAGDFVEVALPGGGARAKAQGTIAAGDLLTSHTDGTLKPCATTRDRIVAVALEPAIVDQLFAVEVQLGIY